MAHVVTERCVDCRYTDCCAVCPVECFWEVTDPAMLVIDPVTCIDCGLCIPECPIYAIYPLAEVPEPYQEWIQKNEDLFAKGTNFTEQTDPLDSAIPLDEIHAREKSKGWNVKDPSAVAEDEGGGGGGAPAAAAAPPPVAPRPVASDEAAEEVPMAPKTPPRAPLDFRVGARIKIGHRVGDVQEMRKGGGGYGGYHDVKVHLEGDQRPVWYLYSALQTFRDQGELEIVDPGPPPNIFQKLFGGA